MVKVTIAKLSQFHQDVSSWFGPRGQDGKFKFQQNVDSPLGECIFKVMPDVEALLRDWFDVGAKYELEKKSMKARYADKVTLTEHPSPQPNTPPTIISNYEYAGKQLEERDRAIQAMWDKLLSDRKELEAKEVEIEPIYVKVVPPVQILPPNFITSFRGLVISPDPDDNKKEIMHVKR